MSQRKIKPRCYCCPQKFAQHGKFCTMRCAASWAHHQLSCLGDHWCSECRSWTEPISGYHSIKLGEYISESVCPGCLTPEAEAYLHENY